MANIDLQTANDISDKLIETANAIGRVQWAVQAMQEHLPKLQEALPGTGLSSLAYSGLDALANEARLANVEAATHFEAVSGLDKAWEAITNMQPTTGREGGPALSSRDLIAEYERILEKAGTAPAEHAPGGAREARAHAPAKMELLPCVQPVQLYFHLDSLGHTETRGTGR
jgi:hypothetical protein